MNPQMNKVFSKLAKAEKTELKSEKVELAIADDFKKLDKSLKNKLGEFNRANDETTTLSAKLRRALPQAEERIKDNTKVINDSKQDIKLALDAIKKADTLAKELGLNADKIDGYKSIQGNVTDLNKRIDTLNSNNSELKKLL